MLLGDKRGPLPVQIAPPPTAPPHGEEQAARVLGQEESTCTDLCCRARALLPPPEPYPRPNALCSQALVPSVP